MAADVAAGPAVVNGSVVKKIVTGATIEDGTRLRYVRRSSKASPQCLVVPSPESYEV